MTFGRPDDDLDDYEEDYEYEADDDGDLKRCQNCGKLCPHEELCYVEAPFGEVAFVCPRCARSIASSGYSSADE
jgi:hypothetical protein